MNNENEILCDGCGFYKDEFFVLQQKNGKYYCFDCRLALSRINPDDIKPVSQEEIDEKLKIALHTPPLKLKDLKEQLKKGREERRKKDDK